jgi:hypothetical protein
MKAKKKLAGRKYKALMSAGSNCIFRIGIDGEDHSSPSRTRRWLVQAPTMLEALAKIVKAIPSLEREEKLTVEPFGVLNFK